jgi:Ca2+-transporting ATPase
MRHVGQALAFVLTFALAIAVLAGGAALAGFPAPLEPVHAVWLGLVTAAFPALALAMRPTDARRLDAEVVSIRALGSALRQAAVLGSVALAAYWWGLVEYGAGTEARTVAVLSLAGALVALAIARRSVGPWILDGLARDVGLWAAGAAVLALQAAALLVVPLRERLGLAPPETVAVEVVLYAFAVVLMVLGTARAMTGAARPRARESK